MPSEIPLSLSLTFYALLVWGLTTVLAGFRILIHSERAGLWARGALLVWLAIPAVLAVSGQLASFEVVPPPLLPLVAGMAVLVVSFSFSPWGRAVAERLPESLLVGSQGFRLPLELVLFGLAGRDVLPVEMTFAGYNYDVVTGVAALVLWRALRRGPVSRSLLWFWNSLGLMLLVVIVTLAVLSFPSPFGWFQPQNRVVAYYPWVLLPTFLVQLALLAHLLVFRKLMTPPVDPGPNL